MQHVPVHTALLTAAPFAPVSVVDLQSHVVVEHNDDDDLLAIYIDAAVAQVQADTGCAIVKQQWQADYECFPDVIRLSKPPLLAVESVKYYDTDGNLQTLDPADYQVATSGIVGRIAPAPTKSWPSVQAGRFNGVSVTYQAGYVDVVGGVAQGEMPVQLRQAVYVLAAHFYENREAVLVGTISKEQPLAYQMLINNHTVSAV
ncbi:MAG: phage head-tail connector protein [Candidatus Reddybacter sp.]